MWDGGMEGGHAWEGGREVGRKREDGQAWTWTGRSRWLNGDWVLGSNERVRPPVQQEPAPKMVGHRGYTVTHTDGHTHTQAGRARAEDACQR